MIKKILIINFVLFWLFSCSLFWSTTTNTNTVDPWLINYDWTDFSVSIPWNWQVIKDWDKSLPKPWAWKIELSLTSKDMKNWFSNNMLILSSEIINKISSKDFSIWNYAWAKKQYISYREIETKDFIFTDWEPSFLHIFEWKYSENTPKLKFLQIWHICNEKKVFFITIALSQDVTDTSKYNNILKTFACKK